MREFGDFDFIIVGAGSAGCVLANRLSAGGAHKVLLLEAGGADTNIWIHIPLGYGKLFADPSVNWMFETTPQRELHGRKIMQPRGKVLGGSSSINGLVYIRGQKEDFDAWRAQGALGWGFDDVLPYFKKAEDQARGANAYHGDDGPLPVSDQREPHPLCDAFIAAAQECGYPANDDFNAAVQEGAGYYQTTSRKGVRVSAAVAYLNPIKSRRNLHIETKAHVTKLVIRDGAVTGIEWRAGDENFFANAGAEVILAAGAIGSPQILELSGVGDGEHLRRAGVETLVDAPGVGAHLQDHLQVRVVCRAAKPVTFNDDMNNPLRTAWIGLRYLVQRKGPLTVSAGYAGGFFRTTPTAPSPDIQVHFINYSTTKMGDKLHRFSGFTASSCQLRPQSRGECHIVSPDPYAAPAIDPNYLGCDLDRRTNVAGIKLLREILHAPSLAPFVEREAEPGDGVRSDEDILDYCRARGASLYHPTCTARMGDFPDAVVDSRLRVRGLRKLRVVDGSIMPSVVSGNSHAAIVMIAEKASDMILEDVKNAGEAEVRK